MKELPLDEDILIQFLKGLDQLAFVSTEYEGKIEEHNPQINDLEAVIEINAQFDREDLKDLLMGIYMQGVNG